MDQVHEIRHKVSSRGCRSGRWRSQMSVARNTVRWHLGDTTPMHTVVVGNDQLRPRFLHAPQVPIRDREVSLHMPK
jgi:hypothetical protein